MTVTNTNLSTLLLKFLLIICIQQVSVFCYSQTVAIKQLKIGRSNENVFASDYFNGAIYYCSDKRIKSKKTAENEYNQNFLDLYSIRYNFETKQLDDEINLGENVNSQLNEGPIKISATNKIGYFSSNRVDSLTSQLLLTLFQAKLDPNNQFEKRSEIFNELYGYNIAHPAISEDGKTLVFSSDNPSSKGQTDLYMSVLFNSIWTLPVAISNINTEAIETFPHFHGNTLYFSSDRSNSLGGLDIYKCTFRNDQFSEPQQLKSPINSEFDDFLYIPISETQGIFSSNRNGSKDRIYQYKIDLPQPATFIEVDDNFCFSLADEGKIDSTRFKHTWTTGDGTTLKGQFVNHCYNDTGIHLVSCDLLDTKTGKKDIAFITAEINIDIYTPTIQTDIEVSQVKFSMDSKYSKLNYTDYYWIVDNNIYTDKNPTIPIGSKHIEVKLIAWEEKKESDAIGIIKNVTLKP